MKKALQFAAFLLLFMSQTMNAQWDDGLWVGKQANNWIFYLDAGLNFSTSPPTALTNCKTVDSWLFGEGTGTISDSMGGLLFSTSIDTVFNKNHQMMQNGYCVFNDVSSTQTGLTIPKPGPGNEYYIFQIGDNGLGWTVSNNNCSVVSNVPELTYTVVDMDMDNGLGAVTSKNNLLATKVSEKLTAVYHANGEDIWVITHEGTFNPLYSSNKFLAFLVSSSGISPTPVVSSVGVSTDYSLGQLKVSPDGSKIAFVASGTTQYLQVFDFDNATGQLSNPMDLTSAIIAPGGGLIVGAWGLEFSPNSRYLYMTEMGIGIFYSRLHQLDLEAGNQAAILASDILLAETIPAAFSCLQLAPDGKIYMANPTSFYPNATVGHLSVIHNPNNAGTAANFEHLAVDLNGQSCSFGLPSFIQSYFESGILHEGDCAGNEVAFSTLRIPGIESAVWDFGDPDSGADNSLTTTDGNAVHVFSEAGTYTVTATITSNGAQQTAVTEIEILPPPEAFPPENLVACDDGTGTALFDLTQQNAVVLGNQDPNTHTVSYHTTQADAENNTNPITNLSQYVSPGQTIIYVRVTNTAGCYGVSQFGLEIAPTPELPGNLELMACLPMDLTQIAAEVDGGLSLGFYPTQADAENSANAIADSTAYFPTKGEKVYLRAENAAGCADIAPLALIGEECSIPQGISPNGDAFNQRFDLSYLNIQNLEIFNRYGRSVFNKESYTNQWFGQTDNGDELPTGTYFYVIKLEEGQTFQNKNVLTGWVYVQREVN